MLLLALIACVHDGLDKPDEETGEAPIAAGLLGLDALGVTNLVVVHADTLRASHLPRYGYARDTMPKMPAWAWLGVSDYTAMDTWTLPSTTTMLTASFPERHGVTHMTPDHVPNAHPELPTLATHLQANGLATFIVSGNSVVTGAPFLMEGWDAQGDHEDPYEMRLGGLAVQTLAWIDSLPEGQPFFAFLQPMDTHGPYDPGERLGTWTDVSALPFSLDDPEDEQVAALKAAYAAASEPERAAMTDAVRALYDETILSTDQGLALLLYRLEERGLLDSTLVVFTADHGETLLEDPDSIGFGHGGTVRRELTQVPLLFHHPRLADDQVRCLSQNTDLAPTVVRALGLPPMDGIDGVALQDGCRDVVRAHTFWNNIHASRPSELLVSDGYGELRWACNRGRAMGYDLTADPDGLNPLPPDETPNYGRLASEMAAATERVVTVFDAEPCIVE